MTEAACLNCGGIFHDFPCHIKRRKFCSTDCYVAHRQATDNYKGRPPAHRFDNILEWLPAKILVTDGCWTWIGSTSRDGYGRVGVNGKTIKAHRLMMHLITEDQPGMFVCHTCDNPACVRPSHLFWGTALDNNRDCKSKGRNAFGDRNSSRKYPGLHAGDKNGRARLSALQVKQIREMYLTGSWTQPALGAQFGVCRSTISAVVRGKTWEK